jgi:hypothetical protein
VLLARALARGRRQFLEPARITISRRRRNCAAGHAGNHRARNDQLAGEKRNRLALRSARQGFPDLPSQDTPLCASRDDLFSSARGDASRVGPRCTWRRNGYWSSTMTKIPGRLWSRAFGERVTPVFCCEVLSRNRKGFKETATASERISIPRVCARAPGVPHLQSSRDPRSVERAARDPGDSNSDRTRADGRTAAVSGSTNLHLGRGERRSGSWALEHARELRTARRGALADDGTNRWTGRPGLRKHLPKR